VAHGTEQAEMHEQHPRAADDNLSVNLVLSTAISKVYLLSIETERINFVLMKCCATCCIIFDNRIYT